MPNAPAIFFWRKPSASCPTETHWPFAGIELGETQVPDETTILNIRRLLEQHQLTAAFMNTINDGMEQEGLLLKGGTLVDATLIHAAPSIKHRDKSVTPTCIRPGKGINCTLA